MQSISKLEKNSTYLKVVWSDGEESKFNYLWLRDNCPTAVSYTHLRAHET